MSSFFYGGVLLQQVRVLSIKKTPVQLGFQYTSTKIDITLEGLFNPAINSYTFGQNTNAPLSIPGFLGPVTEMAVRNTLLQPRGQLVMEAAGIFIVVSPPSVQPGYPIFAPQVAQTATAAAAALQGTPFASAGSALSAIASLFRGTATVVSRGPPPAQFVAADCNNGPVCAGVDVVEDIGDKTFVVRGTWTTWLSEVPKQPKPAPPAPSLITATRRSLAGGQFAAERPVGVGNRPDPNSPLEGILPADPIAQQNLIAAGFDGQDPILQPANPAPVYFPASPLAAHHWAMRHIVDQDFFTTRIIEGQAVFRRDVLLANKLVPDQLRYWLGHPVPWGMKRIRIEIGQEADGVTFNYRILDRDRTLDFDANMFARVEASWSIVVTNKGLEDLLFPNGRISAAGIVAAGADLAGRGILRAIQNNFPGAFPEGMIDFLANRPLLGAVPLTTYHVLGRFWGHPEKQFAWMERQAWEWLTSHLGDVVNFSGGGAVTVGGVQVQLATTMRRTTRDVAGSFCEIEWKCGSSILAGGLALFQQAEQQRLGDNPNARRRQPERRPIYTDPMRGTYVGACVAQALRNAGDAWTQPQDPPMVRDRDQVDQRLFRTDDLAGVITP